MAVRTALLRLFLATILMLNGIASAMAAVQHAEGSTVPAETSEAAQAAPAPLAGGAHDGCGDLDPGLVESASITVSTNGTGHAPGPDCCDPATCQSSCAANTVIPVLASVMHSGFATPGQVCSRPTASWHAAPALPHLMRPPIA